MGTGKLTGHRCPAGSGKSQVTLGLLLGGQSPLCLAGGQLGRGPEDVFGGVRLPFGGTSAPCATHWLTAGHGRLCH